MPISRPSRSGPDPHAPTVSADRLPLSAVTRKTEPPLTADQIRAIPERLGDNAQRIQAVDAYKAGLLCEALGVTISYEHTTRTATVRSRPSLPYRYCEWSRKDHSGYKVHPAGQAARGKVDASDGILAGAAGGLSI